MSIFEDFLNTTPEDGEQVEGIFQCQETECFDIEETATYYPSIKTLKWTCEEGHQNTVEDFNA